MLFYKNLYNQIFETYPSTADELKILSGFVGIVPIQDLKKLPFKTTLVFGLFKENKKKKLHDELVKLHSEKIQILYPNTPSHSKCYVWLKNGVPIKAMIGSANFSSNGLESDYRETLFEVDERQANFIDSYINIIIGSSRACTEIKDDELVMSPSRIRIEKMQKNLKEGVVELSLLKSDGIETHSGHGINWGHATGSNVRIDDACLPISVDDIKLHPELFRPKRELPQGEKSRGNTQEVVELIWDDGVVMKCKFEGVNNVYSQKYPKQLSSFPNKDTLGKYLRDRINVPHGRLVVGSDLKKYGRTSVTLSILEEGVYSADFSTK